MKFDKWFGRKRFEETVFQWNSSKNYHPAGEKGFIESTENGLLWLPLLV